MLIGVVPRPEGPTVLLTQRAATLRSHSAQVAFPGGRVDAVDGSPVVTALREAEEEIGLKPGFVEPIARLPDYRTMTGFSITPVLAVVKPGFALTPNPDEVEHVFEVPLSFLMNGENHVLDSRIWEGGERFFYRMPYENWNIWGVTAGILHTAWERLYAW